jgi:GTP-binding protein
MLEVVVAQHQPPMVNGRRIKLRYAHQGGQNPPIIIIHGKQALKVPKSYQRYLMNHFTKVLKLFGTPLRIEFRQDDNPYQETKRVKPVLDKEEARQKKIERRKRDKE